MSFNEATITLIPKLGKEQIYRPISLKNMDVEFFNKILADPMQEHINKTMQHE